MAQACHDLYIQSSIPAPRVYRDPFLVKSHRARDVLVIDDRAQDLLAGVLKACLGNHARIEQQALHHLPEHEIRAAESLVKGLGVHGLGAASNAGPVPQHAVPILKQEALRRVPAKKKNHG